MEFGTWLQDNWFTLVQSAGIVAGLGFTALALRRDTRSRRITNLLIMTQHHREIWAEMYRRPELARVVTPHVDLRASPVTPSEALFVRLLILHLAAVFRAQACDEIVKLEGLQTDVRLFLAFPVPRAVWEQFKAFQDSDFVAFVERSLGNSVKT